MLKLILSKIFGFTSQSVPDPTKDLSIHPRSNTISTPQYVGDTCQANEKGQGHVHPNSSGEQFFTMAINTPPLLHFSFTLLDLTPARASQNPSAAATSSSPVRKSFTASTSSPRTRAGRGNLHLSLSAEEFANEALKYSYPNFRLLPLKPFHIPR